MERSASFSRVFYAVALSAAASPSDPGFVGGIVCRITPKSSLIIFGPHFNRNVLPDSDGASPDPSKFAP